jgi:hypothetical protein
MSSSEDRWTTKFLLKELGKYVSEIMAMLGQSNCK